MAPPDTADIDLITNTIINDVKYNHIITSDLMDKLISEYSQLSLIIKVELLAKVHAIHFSPHEVVPLLCSYSFNPVNFLVYCL